ncbi:MAG: proton-conducting transporter membrane subunit [Actinomycetota bacterium]|nr:proton-conducting transporter membrane subunit [Actinomycetota bacterium]MDA8075952.1 proton-conducting transporter membrane subunit [Actinomycetota bacterium]
MSEAAYLIGLGAAGAAALLGATLPARRRVLGAALLSSAACVCAFLAAGQVLVSGHAWSAHSAEVLPLTGVSLSLDPLSALFVAAAAVVGLAASCYAIGYAAHSAPSRTATAMLPAFLGSLLLVPAASSVATFMVAWELMALTSLLLLLNEHRQRKEARDAAQWYAAMTHVGAAAILLGLLLLATHAGGQTFAAIAAHRGQLSVALRSAVFVLTLVGFASKAGAVPLHVWLPRAHPEAPSPVSALMSGAMVNLGIYGIIRVGEDLLGGGVLWWWLAVVALGVVSAVFGALHAAASADVKRLLAYSTVDNIGLILVGVGAAGALAVSGERLLAALALLAALFHLVNHALFKGCLFLGAGALQHATGTRDLDRLGGLARRMPVTAALFGIGALSISALPGFNGFASEWLLLESLLHGFADHTDATVVALLIGVAALAITGGLTAAAFVKALGVGFLGQPRTAGAASAREVAPSMLVGMALLAASCIALGIAPGVLLPVLERATASGLAVRPPSPLRAGLGLDLAGVSGAIEPALVVAGLLGALVLAWALVRLSARRSALRHARTAEAWGCGRELQTARMEVTATSFAEPLQRVFVDVLRPDHDLEVTHVAESRFFPQAISYQHRIDDGLERVLYRPVIDAVSAWGRLARRVPNGSVHRYLAFGFVALVLILVVLA